MVKVVPVTRITGLMSRIPLEDSNEKCHEVCSARKSFFSDADFTGRRSSSRRRTLSKERRQSLLFEDQMATYCFVEIVEGFCPSSKSSAGLEPSPSLPPPSPKALSSSGSLDRPAMSPHWTMNTSSPAFIIRVPNESIVRLFSFLVSFPLYCELTSHYVL